MVRKEGKMKGVTVKYFKLKNLPRKELIEAKTVYDHVIAIVNKLKQELTPEEAIAKAGWKVYYQGNKIVKLKQFSKDGFFTGTIEDIQELKKEAEAQKQDKTQKDGHGYGIHIYSHTFYYYNKKGQIIKQKDYDENHELEYEHSYFYDRRKHIVKIITRCFQGTPNNIEEKYMYNKNGILVREERFEDRHLAEISILRFHQNKKRAIIKTLDRDDSLKKSITLKKICENPVMRIFEKNYHKRFDYQLMNIGYRIYIEKQFDLDNTIEGADLFFHDKSGNLIIEKHYNQSLMGIFLYSFYIYYYDEKKRLYKQLRYRTDKKSKKSFPKLFTEKEYLYDKKGRLTKEITKHLTDNEKHERLYTYNRKGYLTEITDSQCKQKILFFYDEKGRKIREETHYENEPPTIEKWGYDKEGKEVEKEFSMTVKLP